jgi:hypothetical protein
MVAAPCEQADANGVTPVPVALSLMNPPRTCGWLGGYAGMNAPYATTCANKCRASRPAHGRRMLTVLGGLAEFERELMCPYLQWPRHNARVP